MRRRNLMLSLLALCLAGLIGLTACGGGNSGGGGGGGGGGGTPATGVTIYPGGNGTTVSVAAGSIANFTAYSADATINVNWTASSGTITGNGSPNGVFTAPTTQGTVTVSAVSPSNSALGGSVTVNVTAAAANGLVVSPGATMVLAGSVTAFSATQNGAGVTPAVWEVNGAPGGDGVHGTINGNGNYTAPLSPPPTGSTTITACLDGACATTATASVTVVFSSASFNGPYAFSYTGDDGSGYLAVAGHFTAEGSTGQIGANDGIEDEIDNNTGVLTGTGGAPIGGGTFTVGPDGRTQVTLATTEVLQIALTASSQGGAAPHGVLIRFDAGATASGTIDAQNPNDLANGFSGHYVFGVSGLDLNSFALQLAGAFFSDGLGTIPANQAEQDINDGGTVLTTPDISLSGSFSPGLTAATDGRGVVNFSSTNTIFIGELGGTSVTTTFAYYIVDSTHLKVIEIDNSLLTAGDFFQETGGNGPFNASVLDQSNYAFTVGGSSGNGGFAAGGVFISGGSTGGGATSGTISGGVYDNNDGGSVKLNLAVTGSYSVDSFGRISFPLTVGGASLTYYGYAGTYNGPNGTPVNVVELIDETGQPAQGKANFVDGGLAYEQTSANTPSGSYALNMSGVATCQNCQGEQDIEGQFATGANAALNGTVDINNIANGFNPAPNVVLTTSSITTVGTDGRGTPLTIHTSSPSSNFPLAYYVIDENTALLLETDSARVLTGVIAKQY